MPMNATKMQPRKPGNGVAGARAAGAVERLTARWSNSTSGRMCRDLPGLGYLVTTLIILSLLAGFRFERSIKLFVAGDVATQDVKAEENLLLEDQDASRKRREQVGLAQPPVYDLSREAALELRRAVSSAIAQVNATAPEAMEALRLRLAPTFGPDITVKTLLAWKNEDFQRPLVEDVLPWVEDALLKGVVSEKRLLATTRFGIIIRDLLSGEESLLGDVMLVADLRDLRRDFEDFLRQELDKGQRFRKSMTEMIFPLLAPTLTLNQEATQARKREVMNAVEPVYTQIKSGEIVVRQGERVTPEQQLKIQALYNRQKERFSPAKSLGVFLISGLVLLGFILSTSRVRSRIQRQDGVFMSSLFLFFGVLAKMVDAISEPVAKGVLHGSLDPGLFGYMLPVAGAMGVMALFFATHRCLFAVILLSFVCGKLAHGGLELVFFYFLTGMFYVHFIKRARSRIELLASVFPLTGSMLLAWAGAALLAFPSIQQLWWGAGLVVFSGLLSLIVMLSLGIITEYVFGYTSRFKLMELMNMEQPLLRELMVNAPGTYHHSIIVSNMVEAAAQAIGANALMAKVAALYHDIGKLKNPHYFIENQFGGINKHDKLAPSMSALILIAHSKKGVELAQEHRFGPELSEIIQQHHGTALISYFYHKAREQAQSRGEVDAIREEDYRYPGPKPQTKEAGLLMLADAVEASSRTLVDPTTSRLKNHIQKIVRGIYNEGQLDEADLTLRDIGLAMDAFLRVLAGIFHQRIEYPGNEKPADGIQNGQDAEKQQPVLHLPPVRQ